MFHDGEVIGVIYLVVAARDTAHGVGKDIEGVIQAVDTFAGRNVAVAVDPLVHGGIGEIVDRERDKAELAFLVAHLVAVSHGLRRNCGECSGDSDAGE